jgi:hypothetical protein
LAPEIGVTFLYNAYFAYNAYGEDTMAFKDLKRKNLKDLTSEMEKLSERNNSFDNSDDNLWRPKLDSSNTGYAVLRFLPAPDGEDLPWVRVFDHGFKGPTGKWYIENSLTTIGQKDPCSEFNSSLWNSGIESDKDVARKQKRRLNYYSNVYVKTDQLNPENEGKVFLFRYGKKIFDKLTEAMQPDFEDDTPVNPFDLWDGADFKLKIRIVEGYWNYDKSGFAEPSQFLKDEDEMETIWKQTYSLSELISPAKFKSYDELKTKLNGVLGIETGVGASTPAPAVKSVEVDEGDDPMSYFEKLANS